MKRLTKAEEQVMQILWDLDRGLVRMSSTSCLHPSLPIILCPPLSGYSRRKGFVDHKAYGTTYEYFPLIKKEEYTRVHFSDLMENYFNNSFPEMAAFFARENNLSLDELQDMIKMTENELKS